VQDRKFAKDSPEYLLACVKYLQFAEENHQTSVELSPSAIRAQIETAMEALRQKLDLMKRAQRRDVFRSYQESVEAAAVQFDLLPAILMMGDYTETPQDSFKWYYYAANDKKDPYAMRQLGRCYYTGLAAPPGNTGADKAAFEAFDRAATAGDQEAAVWRARCYLSGRWPQKSENNEDLAVKKLQELAAGHVPMAETWMGISHVLGAGRLKDLPLAKRYDLAIGFYKDAIRDGDWYACWALAKLYKEGMVGKGGETIPPKPGEVKALYKLGAENEDAACLFEYGKSQYEVATNAAERNQALALVKEAVQQTWLPSYTYEYGVLLYSAAASPSAKAEAIELIKKAADAKSKDAIQWLADHRK
jgi:TPR repeat protein